MEVIKSPCKDCMKRADGCHSFCPEYLKFRAFRDSINKKHLAEDGAKPRYWFSKKMI